MNTRELRVRPWITAAVFAFLGAMLSPWLLASSQDNVLGIVRRTVEVKYPKRDSYWRADASSVERYVRDVAVRHIAVDLWPNDVRGDPSALCQLEGFRCADAADDNSFVVVRFTLLLTVSQSSRSTMIACAPFLGECVSRKVSDWLHASEAGWMVDKCSPTVSIDRIQSDSTAGTLKIKFTLRNVSPSEDNAQPPRCWSQGVIGRSGKIEAVSLFVSGCMSGGSHECTWPATIDAVSTTEVVVRTSQPANGDRILRSDTFTVARD